MPTICGFDFTENKHDACRSEDCLKKFWESLKELAMKIVNFEKKKILPLTNKGHESYAGQEFCHICREKLRQ